MDAQFKIALKAAKWADTGDRLTPEDTNNEMGLIALSRTQGWPGVYSAQDNGKTPDRRRVNQLMRELYGALHEVALGISQYDNEVDYPVNSITNVQGALYYAVTANGPSSTVVSPTQANQTAWSRVTGSLNKPEAPHTFLFTPDGNNRIAVQWKNGRDGGAQIDNYDFNWRIVGGSSSWSSLPNSIQYPYHVVIGQSGQVLQVRVRARNSHDVGEWGVSTIGAPNTTFTGAVPGGGDTLGLIATGGNAQASLSWQTPSTGGFPLLRYIIQWRDQNQTFSTARQLVSDISSGTNATITGLVNDTLYQFRVRAVNQAGPGEWSNIASATPESPVLVLTQPIINAPLLTAISAGYRGQVNWAPQPNQPTAQPTSATWQNRNKGTSKWINLSHTSLTELEVTGLNINQAVEVRYRLNTSLGNTDWSPASEVTATSGPPDTPRIVRDQLRYLTTEERFITTFFTVVRGNNNGSYITNVQWRIQYGNEENNTFIKQYSRTFYGPVGIPGDFQINNTPNHGTGKTNFARIEARYRNSDGWSGWGSWQGSGTEVNNR